MATLKLFCFPYAGGSSAIFYKWKQYLSPNIELRPVELAGRGKRIREPFYADIEDATEDILNQIGNELTQSPYAFFGHSMGALISYRLAHKINRRSLDKPSHLFFSGKGAPHIKKENAKKYHLMDSEIFKKEMIGLGGTPPEFFDYPELMELYLPLLKNDFKIVEKYVHDDRVETLTQDMTIFLGKEDDLTPAQCTEWEKHTVGKCKIHYFNGGHFFLNHEIKSITDIINRTLVRTTKSSMARVV